MLLRPNPKSLKGLRVRLQMFWGTLNTTERGFFGPDEDGVGFCSVSENAALTGTSFFCNFDGKTGRKLVELYGAVNSDEDNAVQVPQTWTIVFPSILNTKSGNRTSNQRCRVTLLQVVNLSVHMSSATCKYISIVITKLEELPQFQRARFDWAEPFRAEVSTDKSLTDTN